MKRASVIFSFIFVFSFFGSIFLQASGIQDELPQTELPVLITSCGQSPGVDMVSVLFMRLKLQAEPKAYEKDPLASADLLKTAKEEGTPYRSLIIVMGASLKGMGAAGISIDDEIDRIRMLIKEARNQGITIIGSHIEGMKRRAQGAAPGDNTDEMSIDAVAPESDILLINEEGNEDRRFSIIAEEKTIPLIEVEKNLDLLDELKKLFDR